MIEHPWTRETRDLGPPLEWRFSFELEASPEELWPILIDTDRLDRAMEGYGFSRAVGQAPERVQHLVICGICDDGSSAKDDRWYEYAAAAAAGLARHFLAARPLG
ncbi:hypothetical protein ACMHYB_21235 [Sorangium sp. So ce1128]